jgi:serine/threonine protein kinase
MFEKVEKLGNGSFGKVYKVKCLKTSKISNQDANKRISFIE